MATDPTNDKLGEMATKRLEQRLAARQERAATAQVERLADALVQEFLSLLVERRLPNQRRPTGLHSQSGPGPGRVSENEERGGGVVDESTSPNKRSAAGSTASKED